MSDKSELRISEVFHSLQGEGSTTGKPSVFYRLTGCNLMCGGRGTEKDGELHNGATWRCDTIEVWLKGRKAETKKEAFDIYDQYYFEFLKNTQLVITGGEPLLQQKDLNLFTKTLLDLMPQLRIEIETNGTILPSIELQARVAQFNVSPKLSNSGMDEKYRIKSKPMETLVALSLMEKAIFKFVVTQPEDYKEILDEYIIPFDIPKDKIYLMPGCSNREQYEKVGPMVASLCMEHGHNFSGRLQINLWNETTGV